MRLLTLCLVSVAIWASVHGQAKGGSGGRNIPTVTPAKPFNPTATCALLKTAMSGAGRDSATIMRILSDHTLDQRIELAATYKSLYGQDLVQQLQREYDGVLQDVMQYLFWPLEKMYAREFREAVRGLGTDEDSLIELLVSIDGTEFSKISSAYQQMYDRQLKKDIYDDTSGYFRDLLLTLLEGRPSDITSYPSQLPRNTAEAWKNIPDGQWKSNKDSIRDIFCKKSFAELRATFEEYEKLTGRKIEDVIENEFSKDAKKTLLSIIKCARNRSEYFAERITYAMQPTGFKLPIMNRIIIGRSEIDLGNIKETFYAKYNQNIDVFLKHSLEGYYWDLMVQLAGFSPQFFTS